MIKFIKLLVISIFISGLFTGCIGMLTAPVAKAVKKEKPDIEYVFLYLPERLTADNIPVPVPPPKSLLNSSSTGVRELFLIDYIAELKDALDRYNKRLIDIREAEIQMDTLLKKIGKLNK